MNRNKDDIGSFLTIGALVILLLLVGGVLLAIGQFMTLGIGMMSNTTEMKVMITGGPIQMSYLPGLDAGVQALEACAEELPELPSPDAGVPIDATVDAWVNPDAWTEMWGDLR